MEAPAPLKPPEITSPLKSEPQALIFPHQESDVAGVNGCSGDADIYSSGGGVDGKATSRNSSLRPSVK